MRLVQFQLPEKGRRVGVVNSDMIYDLAAIEPGWDSVYAIFQAAQLSGTRVAELIEARDWQEAPTLDYGTLWDAYPGDQAGWLLSPLDHPDPGHCIVAGTGLTHLGSMAQRNAMHQDEDTPASDSQKMFEMGVVGGKPKPEQRGVSPECFYKGTGVIVRAHHEALDIPAYAMDGGEEPEIVGCYVIDAQGIPRRLGFAVGNEWADHAMERVNYLWLAPSKLRSCAIGPELVLDEPFADIRGTCRILRGGEQIYHSGELLTGEENMCHALSNLEDHHFKYPQFRQPGDVHLYFFGTMKLSYGSRGPLENGDVVEIAFPSMGRPLVNTVCKANGPETIIQVLPG